MPTPEQPPRGRDLRKGRYSEPGRPYLLTTVTQERQSVFADLFLGRIVVQSLRHQHDSGRAQSTAFVVMPDHLHWLVEPCGTETLDTLMRRVKSYTAVAVNRARDTRGQKLWQAGYHDHALRKHEDLRQTARYIIANPLRAGLVENIGDYPLWDAIWLKERACRPRLPFPTPNRERKARSYPNNTAP